MSIWERFKNYFYQNDLADALKAGKAVRQLTNLNDAKHIGVLYDSTYASNDIVITKFAESLRQSGKQVELLGYVNDPKIDHKADIKIYNSKGVNWYGAPTDERALDFSKIKFDLLLCCYTNQSSSLEFLARTSLAKWRVGTYAPNKTACYDMMINTGGKNEIGYLIEQIKNFLNNIHYDNKQI
jgi:hypothetical protein